MKYFLISLFFFSAYYSADAIRHGQHVTIRSFPFVAQLELSSDKGDGFCAGAIVSEKYILTAAYCLSEKADANKNNVQVRVGGTNPKTGEKLATIEKIEFLKNSDVALIQLAEPLQFNDFVQPIKVSNYQPPVGTELWAFGFGDRYGNLVQLTQGETEVTEESDGKRYEIWNMSFCTGDVGGPLVYNEKLVGIIAEGCAPNGSPNYAYDVTAAYNVLKSNYH